MPATRKTKQKRESSRKSYETTKLFLIQDHYAGREGELTWDVNRFRRLCAALKLTEYELGAFIRLAPNQVTTALRVNHFLPTVELHLTLIERTAFPSVALPIFPSIS